MTLEFVCAARRAADKEKDRDMYSTSKASTGFGGNGNHAGQYSSSAHGSSRSDVGSRSLARFHRDSRRSRSYAPQGRDYRRTSHSPEADLTEEEEEEEEDEEAITPPSTWGKDDQRWMPAPNGAHTTRTSASLMAMADGRRIPESELPKGVEDDAMFKAALALCGLGRRT